VTVMRVVEVKVSVEVGTSSPPDGVAVTWAPKSVGEEPDADAVKVTV